MYLLPKIQKTLTGGWLASEKKAEGKALSTAATKLITHFKLIFKQI